MSDKDIFSTVQLYNPTTSLVNPATAYSVQHAQNIQYIEPKTLNDVVGIITGRILP